MSSLPQEFAQYLRASERLWIDAPSPGIGDGTILVDLMHDNQWYIRQNCLFARYLQVIYGGRIVGVQYHWTAPTLDYDAEKNRLLAYASGVEEIIDLDEAMPTEPGAQNDVDVLIESLTPLRGTQLRTRLLGAELGGDPDFGRLVYDTWLRSARVETVDAFTPALAEALKRYARMQALVAKLFAQRRVRHCVLGHVEYLPYAFLAHETVDAGGQVHFFWPVVPGTLRVFSNRESLRRNRTDGFENMFLNQIVPVLQESAIFARFSDAWPARLEQGSRQRSTSDLMALYGMRGVDRFSLLFCHALSDAVHANGSMLFDDFGQWIEETVEHFLEKASDGLIVKMHPKHRTYSQNDFLPRLIRATQGSDNVRIVPAGTHNAEWVHAASAISTVHGTPGYEAAALGGNACIAGKSRYSDLGVAAQPMDKTSYWSRLREPCLPDQRTRERALLFAFSEQYVTRAPSALITYAQPRLSMRSKAWTVEADRMQQGFESDPMFVGLVEMLSGQRDMFLRLPGSL